MKKQIEKEKSKQKVIVVSGTPGTGKTTIAKIIIKKLKGRLIELNKKIRERKTYEKYDKKLKCFITDKKRVISLMNKLINDNRKKSYIIIDSHMSHFLPMKKTDYCIITVCDIKELKKRLIKRRYSKQKIRDNLDSEIFDICYTEAEEEGHKPIKIDTSKIAKAGFGKNIKNIGRLIKKIK